MVDIEIRSPPSLPRSDEEEENWIQKLRKSFAQEMAEFVGTSLIVLFGLGAECQARLYDWGNMATRILGWATGYALGSYISRNTSGGHINPAVTLPFVLWRRFPLGKGVRYIFAQIVGAAFGTLIVYLIYYQAIRNLEGSEYHPIFSNQSIVKSFITYPDAHVSLGTAWFEEFMTTSLLVALFFAFTDSRNPPAFSVPIALLISVLGLGVAFGRQTHFAINPARDFGPRLMLWILGYGKEIWRHDTGYWVLVPWLACIPGGLVGSFLYEFWFNPGSESVFNEPPISI